jgi:NADP-dependent 3-hydroxy acid dehydrogenase YdfG
MPISKTHAGQKTAFLTGASSGIGKAAAAALTNEGYRVIGTSRHADPDAVRDGIRMIACDVTSDESVAVAVARAHAELGQIDLLVNNAGVGVTGAAEESSIAQVRSLFETNFHGVVRVTNAVLPIMRVQVAGAFSTSVQGSGSFRLRTAPTIRQVNTRSRGIRNRSIMRYVNSAYASLSSSRLPRALRLKRVLSRLIRHSPPTTPAARNISWRMSVRWPWRTPLKA